MRHKTLTIADLYDQPPLMDLPTFAGFTGTAVSTIYNLAAAGRLPVETVQLGRKKWVRTIDVLTWLHLPSNSEAARGPALTASEENDHSASTRNGTNS